MKFKVIDITDYLEYRRHMRLLPNLADLGIAYGVFRPVINLPPNIRVFAGLPAGPVSSWLYYSFITDPVGFVLGAVLYVIYAVAQSAFKGIVGLKIKALVLSDSVITLWIIFGFLFVYFSGGLMLGLFLGGGLYLLVAVIPGVWLYACYRYLSVLKKLERHPLYRHLVGVPRRIFAYSNIRYDFFSSSAWSVYWATFRSAGKLALAYVFIGTYLAGLLILASSPGVKEFLDRWMSATSSWVAIPLILLAVFVISQPAAYARRFVANAWIEWTRKLRANLTRTAQEVSQRDRRPPILFLRSFQDDQIKATAERYWGHAILGIKRQEQRLEEVLAETLFAFGPLVALSNPSDMLRPLGAARENIENGSWQREILRYMSDARWIVLVVGSTPNLQWEINEIIRGGFLRKTLVVFPPDYHDPKNDGRLIVNGSPELATCLGFKERQEERQKLNGALLVSWIEEGNVMIITQDGEMTARGYSDAVRLTVSLKENAMGTSLGC